jgi:hypothetical protein
MNASACGISRRFSAERGPSSLQLRLAGGGSSHERTFLCLNSLLTGKKAGNFHEFRHGFAPRYPCKRFICGGLWTRERSPVLREAGIFFVPSRELKSPNRESKWLIRELDSPPRKEETRKASAITEPIGNFHDVRALAAHAGDPLIRLQPLSSCGYPGKTWYFAGASRRQSFVPGGTGHAYRSRAKCTGSKLDAHTDVFFFSW